MQHFSRNIAVVMIITFLSFSIISFTAFLPKESYGHAFVTSSKPSFSQSLASSPTQVNVFFSEPVDIRYSKLKILDENGKQIGTDDLQYLNGDQSSLSVKLPTLKDGVYTVSTTVLSQTDGHVTDNAFVFAVGQTQIPSNISSSNSQKSVVYIPEALARFPTLVGQVIIIGGAFSTFWLWKPVDRIQGISSLIGDIRKKIDKRLISIFLIGSIILVASDFAILVFQAQAISAGLSDVIATRFGMVVLARTILSITILSISLLLTLRAKKRTSQILTRGETAGILSIGLALLLTTSMIGHGAANNQFTPIAIDFAHNLAASIWIGGVLYLGLVFTSKLRVDNSINENYKIALISLIIPRFSVLVVVTLGFVLFSGPVLLFILDDNLGQVLSSTYGYTLIVKLSLALVMLAIGSYNQFSIQKKAQRFVSAAISVSTNGKGHDSSNFPDPDFDERSHNVKKTKANDSRDVISKFSRSTKIESIIGILLLASVAFLVNTGLPESEKQSPIQEQPFSSSMMLQQQVQDGFRSTYFADNNTMVVLSIAPFTVGSNNFTISFVDSHNNPIDVSSATLQSKEPEQSIGPIIIDLDKVSKGVFKATAAFGIPGLWDLQIEGIPNTPNSAAISATFNDLRIKPRLDQFQFNITEFNTPSNLSQPLYPIYDKSRNSIWVGDTALDSSQILEFKLGSKEFVEHKINGTSIITIMALDSKNTIWFIDPINKLIGSYNIESGQSKLFPLPKEIVPSSIAVDPNDKLWIASSPTGQILIFDPAVGSFTKVIELGVGSRPLAIAINPNSGLAWVSDETGKLFMIDPLRNYNVTSFAPTLPSSALKSPTGLLIDDTNEKVYISQHEGHKVTAFDTIVQNFQDYPPLNPDGLPFGMAFDNYGNLWVAEHTINKIAVIDPQTAATKEVTIPNPNPFVQWLTADSDGNIWIAEQRGHALGLVTSQVSRSNIAELKSQTPATQSEENLPLPLINYNLVAVGIVIGSILVALMYVKNIIDCRVAEKTIRKYESIKY